MNPHNVDLYTELGLDPGDDTDSLRILITGRDAQLEAQGIGPQDPRRQHLQTAYAVLGTEETRREYDTAVMERRPLSWHEVTYLGNYGTLPKVDPFTPHPQAAAPVGPISFSQSGAQHTGYLQPPPQERATAGTRLGMVLVDGLIMSMATGLVLAVLGGPDVLNMVLTFLVMVLYVLGFETRTGGTPAKHIFGYQVRDIETRTKPTLEQSAKRNWWRLVNIVPGLGSLISFIGMIAIGSSIKDESGNIGSHDRWAGTEVVKRGS